MSEPKPEPFYADVGNGRALSEVQIDPSILVGLPDVNSAEFKAGARRESLIIASIPTESEDQAFIDSITDWSED